MRKFLGKLDLLSLIIASVIIIGAKYLLKIEDWTTVIAVWVLYLAIKE